MKSSKLILICFLFLDCQTLVGQQGFNSLKGFGPVRCNDNSRRLDTAYQGAASDQLIIVIARLGDGDVRPKLNQRRLHNVRAYWTEFLKGESERKPETIILA